MDDEECLPENGNLNMYLQSLGFKDLQIKKSTPNSNTISFNASSPKPRKSNVELIDDDIVQQIGILISTQMLFEEDVKNIENLLSNFKVKKHGMLKNMFQGTFGIILIFVGVIFYFLAGSYMIFIGTSLYAYKAADYLWRKNFSQRRLKKLASILQSNYSLLSKTVKFINENDKFVDCDNFNNNEVSDNLKHGFDFYHSFRSDFCSSLSEMIQVLTNSTKKLISDLPLYDYVENPKYYICNNICDHSEKKDLAKLYQIYLLVQSEFLQRFILSMIPNLGVSKDNNFQILNKILTESCVGLLKIKNNLNRKFKFVFFNGIHSSKSKLNLNSFIKPKIHLSSYEEELASNIHDVSNTFQNLLIKSRTLEENIKQNNVSPEMENELMNLQTELNLCQRNISDGFILLKKASGVKKEQDEVRIEKETVEEGEMEKEKIEVGYTDLDPTIEDEIFEAYFGEETDGTDYSKLDDWDFEDLVKKKLQKEFSKNVMIELKAKLIEKAKIRERKEAEILAKKLNVNVLENQNKMESVEVSDDKIDEKSNVCADKNFSGSFLESKRAEENISNGESETMKSFSSVLTRKPFGNSRNEGENTVLEEGFHNGFLGFVDKSFLSDLGVARRRILQKNSGQEEQFFCDNESENSE